MAGSVNKVILIGNLGKDPQVKSFDDGGRLVMFSLATNETWKDKSGQKQDKVEWHNVIIRNEGLGKVAEQYLRKGSPVYIEGQLQTRKWTDQQGQERYTTEVVVTPYKGALTLLGDRDGGGRGDSYEEEEPRRGGRGGEDRGGRSAPPPSRGSGQGSRRPPMDDLDDDIPF